MHSDRLIILFVKAPLPGAVKSRLAAVIGPEAAVSLYRMFVLDAVDMLADTGYDFHTYYAPSGAAGMVEEMLGRDRPLLAQSGPDLGNKMENAFQEAFSLGYERVILVGSDIPDLSRQVIDEAFEALERNDAVLGPAADGGYYLVGFRNGSMKPAIFRGISWSTATVFDETRRIMHAQSLRLHTLPIMHDVDSLDDLKAFWERNRTGSRKTRALEYIQQHRHVLF